MQLFALFDQCQILHIHREGNMVADLLAKESINHSKGICILSRPPAFFSESLFDDILGVSRIRKTCSSHVG
jgi:hypothetical protein